MAARCAACGLPFFKRDKFRFVEHFVLHEVCLGIPRETWAAEADQRREVRLVQIRLESAERREGETRAKIDVLEARVRTLVDQVDAARRARKPWHENDVLQRRNQELETELAVVRDDLATARQAVALARLVEQQAPDRRPTRLFDRQLVEIGMRALGLAVGRGIWGMGAWFARIALDRDDASVARYSLLELT